MIRFFHQFVKNPRTTGAVIPSSTQLSELMVRTADIAHADAIVEFGPGTGVVTEHIVAAKKPDATFFALELNEKFFHETRKRVPDATVYHDTAVNIAHYLKQHDLTHCDVILSGLPWSVFPDQLQNELLDVILASLKPGGRFVTFAYVPFSALPGGRTFKQKLNDRFPSVITTNVIWRNVPPAFVYKATK